MLFRRLFEAPFVFIGYAVAIKMTEENWLGFSLLLGTDFTCNGVIIRAMRDNS